MINEEKYDFTPKARRNLIIVGFLGLMVMLLGTLFSSPNVEHDNKHESPTEEKSKHNFSNHAENNPHETVNDNRDFGSANLFKRMKTNLWINNVYFIGLGIIGLFFVAIQYAAQAGWSAGIIRIPLAMASWLPYGAVLMILTWFFLNHDIFHWTHGYLYDMNSSSFDKVIYEKGILWYWPMKLGTFPMFYVLRMAVFLIIWIMFYYWIKREIQSEELDNDVKHWYKLRKYSAIFLVVFAVTSSVAAWDWVMSIDPHWFSTMFGWYVFSSWWVNGLAVIALIVVMLKQKGYLSIVNSNHLHDLGKFIFGFSVFWAYIWFSQFLLIYYANIPEETVYFIQRLGVNNYKWVFFTNLFLNFFLPFLLLMTRDSKRHMSILQLVCPIIVLGHWFDFYLMITPGVMKYDGAFGLIEIGMAVVFMSMFLLVTYTNLSNINLFSKNHPFLKESLHHHI